MPGPAVLSSTPPVTSSNQDPTECTPPQADPGVIHIQLIPHSDTPGRPVLGDVVERKFEEGMRVRIGRQVIRDGLPTVMKGSKPPTDNDIWYSSKVVSRNHAEMWVKDGQIYIKDIGSSSGTFLNKMRLSPSGKESRPYPLKEGDILQFGIDYKGKPDDIYKSVMVRIGFYDQSWVQAQRRKANPARFRTALKMLLAAANPYASANSEQTEEESGSTDCCICIGAIGPFQALFVAPCSHCYHYKCVHGLLAQSAMFQCPMCRQVANLAASVSMDSLFDDEDESTSSVAGDSIGRKMGQLRTGEDNPDATLSAAQNAIQRLQQSVQPGSGDVTPRNERSGTPAPVSPESDTSGRSTPNPLGEPSARRPHSAGASAGGPQSGASTPDRSVASPTARAPKRRSSITSKINALLRRGHRDTSNSSTHQEEPSPPPVPIREESLRRSEPPIPDENDEPPISPVSPTSEEGLKRNMTALTSVAGMDRDRSTHEIHEDAEGGNEGDISNEDQ
ncbi:hypothetical protein SpCBS45565_g07127 [Spizellomyces sp. 'palustris']|nr:hypothetical protein SpCBS45565_g07127 [Spizellomyces sp. 'palustris']